MSIFSDINFDKGSDNPFGLDPGTYEVTISESYEERSKAGNLGWWITFSTDDGKSIRKWTTMPESDQGEKDYARNTSFLRMLFRQLEIPESRWDKFDYEDVIGLDCVITVTPQKKNPEYNMVAKIARSKGTPMQTSDNGGAFIPEQTSVPADGGYKF